jgi:hypothetical protein
MSHDSSVGITTDYGLHGRGFDSWQGQDFSVLRSVHTGSGTHPAFSTKGTGGFLPGTKAAGA